MLQFSKLISILSFLIIIYSIYAIRLEEGGVVFYMGTLITSLTIFILSVGILSMSIVHKKAAQKKRSEGVKS